MRYHRLKNFFIATATAALCRAYMIPSMSVLKDIFSILYVFTMMMFLLGEADKSFARKRREKREDKQSCEEKTKSA